MLLFARIGNVQAINSILREFNSDRKNQHRGSASCGFSLFTAGYMVVSAVAMSGFGYISDMDLVICDVRFDLHRRTQTLLPKKCPQPRHMRIVLTLDQTGYRRPLRIRIEYAQSVFFPNSSVTRSADLNASSNKSLNWIALTLEMWAVSRKLACPFLTR
jgi:hypothetical protein